MSDKSRKLDRNRKSGQNLVYKNEHRHEKSHIRRIKKHILRYGKDPIATERLLKYGEHLGLHVFNSVKEFIAAQKGK